MQENEVRTSRFTESQIVTLFKEVEFGIAVAEFCKKHGFILPIYYQ